MRKTSKIICTMVGAVSAVMVPDSLVYAHDLEKWANYYPNSSANTTNSFGIMNSHHIRGRTDYYRWTMILQNLFLVLPLYKQKVLGAG